MHRLTDQLQIDLAILHTDSHHLNPQLVTQPETHGRVLADQPVLGGIVMEEITAERRDMHQPFNIDTGQLNKEPERHHGRNHTVELFADVVTQVLAFEPGHDIAGSVVGAALGHRGVFAQLLHAREIVGVLRQLRIRLRRFHDILGR